MSKRQKATNQNQTKPTQQSQSKVINQSSSTKSKVPLKQSQSTPNDKGMTNEQQAILTRYKEDRLLESYLSLEREYLECQNHTIDYNMVVEREDLRSIDPHQHYEIELPQDTNPNITPSTTNTTHLSTNMMNLLSTPPTTNNNNNNDGNDDSNDHQELLDAIMSMNLHPTTDDSKPNNLIPLKSNNKQQIQIQLKNSTSTTSQNENDTTTIELPQSNDIENDPFATIALQPITKSIQPRLLPIDPTVFDPSSSIG